MDAWLQFVDAFPRRYADRIASDQLKRMMARGRADLFSGPNLVFLGANMTLVRLLMDHFIAVVLAGDAPGKMGKLKKSESRYDIRCPSVQGVYECAYASSSVHVEVDFAAHKGYERAIISEFLSKHLCAIRSITGPKHVVVLHNTQALSTANINALRKVLESHANVVFLLSCTNLSRLSNAVASRCLPLRCCVSQVDALDLMRDVRGERGERATYDPCLSLTQNIVSNLIVGDAVEEEEGGVRKKIKRLLLHLKSSSGCGSDFEGTSKKIRAFSYDMPRFHVSVAIIFKVALGVMHEEGERDIARAVALAAKLQHQSVSMSKPYLAIERFFMEYYLLCSGFSPKNT
jgi:hypothetical protein